MSHIAEPKTSPLELAALIADIERAGGLRAKDRAGMVRLQFKSLGYIGQRAVAVYFDPLNNVMPVFVLCGWTGSLRAVGHILPERPFDVLPNQNRFAVIDREAIVRLADPLQ